MTIQIICPNRRERERDYVFGVIFSDWLNLKWSRVSEERHDYAIRVPGHPGEIKLPDIFFGQNDDVWLTESALPKRALDLWDSRDIGIGRSFRVPVMPILYGDKSLLKQTNSELTPIPLDIFGATFFMLSAYDELVSKSRDKHNRFLGKDSTAYKNGFLDRPIIDQYVEVLWCVMERVWPALKRSSKVGEVIVTCDVDVPFDPRAKSLTQLARGVAIHAIRREGLKSGIGLFRNYRARKSGSMRHDPFFTFDWYMNQCEKAGRTATFYFISGNTAGAVDGDYSVHDHDIQALIRSILQRGHDIGVHGSYNSYLSEVQVKIERENLIRAITEAGIDYRVEGSRQHYLRWNSAETPDCLESAGYSYDSTGSYADLPGFRYGTAKPFPMWSWKDNRMMKLVQKPLICMECSVMADRYMGLGHSDEAYSTMHNLKTSALSFGGNFTLLWHNNQLNNDKDRFFFSSLLS